jgi:hypothetical protein
LNKFLSKSLTFDRAIIIIMLAPAYTCYDTEAESARAQILACTDAARVRQLLPAFIKRWPADAGPLGVELLRTTSSTDLTRVHELVRVVLALIPDVSLIDPDASLAKLPILLTYLERARLQSPGWSGVFERVLALSPPDMQLELRAIPEAQWWFMQSAPSDITEAELKVMPEETVLALYWNTLNARRLVREFGIDRGYTIKRHDARVDSVKDVHTKLRLFFNAKRTLSVDLANALLQGTITFIHDDARGLRSGSTALPHHERWSTEQTYLALLRLCIELGADPTARGLRNPLRPSLVHATYGELWCHLQATQLPRIAYAVSVDPSPRPLNIICEDLALATPVGSLLQAGVDEVQQRMLAVAMARHPRLGANSLLAHVDSELLRAYLAPACTYVATLPKTPVETYTTDLRMRLLYNADISMFHLRDTEEEQALLTLWWDSVRSRAPVTAQLVQSFRARLRGAGARKCFFTKK